MKNSLLLFALLLLSHLSFSQATSIHPFKVEAINGDSIDFSKFRGKKLMIVNTASFCSYTPQYAVLQDLYEQYKQYNFEIVGFPCNDFGSQDPGSDSTINQFCNDYGVTFQMMSKVRIVTSPTDPIYKWLQLKTENGVSNATVDWNFNKFLIDEAGHWVSHKLSAVSPLHSSITNWIMTPSVLPLEALIRADKPTGCYGDTIRLTTDVFGQTFPNPALNYSWTATGKGELIQNNATAMFVLGDSGDVSINLTVTEGNKTATPVFTLTNTGFNLDVEAVPNTLDCNQQAVITASTSGSAESEDGQYFEWNASSNHSSNITVSQAGAYTVTVTNNSGCSRSATVDVTSVCVTGVDEPQSGPSITLLPNPSNGSFIIATKEITYPADVNIYDETGRNITRVILHQSNEQLDLGYLQSGVYLLSINSKENPITTLFTITK